MRQYRFGRCGGSVDGFLTAGYDGGFFRNQHRHARPLWLIVLLCNIENTRPNHIRHLRKYLGKSVGIILFVNIFDIVPLFSRRFCIANIINIETQRFREIVKSI